MATAQQLEAALIKADRAGDTRAAAAIAAELKRVRSQRVAPAPKPAPKKPEDGGFLQDVKDTAISAGKATLGIAEGILYPFERLGLSPSGLKESVGVIKQKLESGRSAASLAEEARQKKDVQQAAPGFGSKILSVIGRGAELVSANPDPMVQAFGLIGSALLPKTETQAAQQITKVTTPFKTGLGAAEFIASQAPSTAATILTGGGARAAALASGLERTAANQIAQRVAVGTGTTLNATDAGYGAAQDVLAKGGTQAEADRAYAIAAAGAALTSKVAAKLPGLEQTAFAGKAAVPGIIRGAVRSAAGEAPQEFIEEGGAKLATNVAKLGTAAEVPIGEDVLSSGALGAIAGAGIAAPVGAIQGFAARGEAPPAGGAPPPPTSGAEPLRTTTVSYPNRDDPTAPITRTMDVMSEPDAEGKITVRDDAGQTFKMRASKLAEMEAATPAYAPSTEAVVEPAPMPPVDAAANLERLRVASGVTEGAKEPPRVRSLAKDVTDALAANDPVSATSAVQKRVDALAGSRMSETTKAQRQAELDEAQSIINDYRVEYGRARAEAPAVVTAPTVEPESVEQALEQNFDLAEREADREAVRAEVERKRLARESEFETASNVGQGSPIAQAQTERQQLFQSIIEDDTIPNPAGAFRQALRDRGFTNVELNESERRQVQGRRAFTKPAAIVPFTGEEIAPEVIEPAPAVAEPIEAEFTEVPAPLPEAPPEVVAGAATPAPSRRAQLMAGTAIEPGVPGVAFGEEPAPRPMRGAPRREVAGQRGAPTKPERMAAAQQLMDILASFGFKDVKVVVKDILVDSKGKLADGLFRPVDSLILVAMSDPGSMSSTTFHELIHYLKDRGFFTDAEWSAILRYAKRDLIVRGITEYKYIGDSKADRDEEIVAEVFRNWADIATGGRPQNNIFAKIQSLLNSIRDFFFKQNLQDAQSVFNAIVNGEFAAREAKPSARVAEAAARGTAPSERPIYAGRSITRSRVLGGAVESKIIQQNLNAAEDMESAGVSSEEIRVATGWERNPYDNEWRYIQPDDMASETPLLDELIADYDGTMALKEQAMNADRTFDLGDLMDHAELYSIYPFARSIRVRLMKSGGGQLQGSFDPETERVTLYADAVDPLGTLLHEVQHWVQKKEGFAFGSSPSTVWGALSDEQKRVEAQAAVDVLNSDLDDLTQVSDVLGYLNSSPEFRTALEDGTAMSDLDDFFSQAFDDDVIVDDRIYALIQGRLDGIVGKKVDLGLAETSLSSEDVLNELNDVTKEIAEKTRLLDAIKDGDPTEEGSDAEEAAREAFEEHTQRNTIRYLDTAGEIEARDVSAQRRKNREQLLAAGMLASEKPPRPGAVVVTKPGAGGAAASIAPQPNPTVTPSTTQGAKLGFLANIRSFMSDMYRKHLYKYSAAPKLDKQLANALGVKTLPKQMSLEDRASMFETMRSGMLRDFNRMWFTPFKAMLKASGIDPQDLSMYLWARSAPARNAIVAERNRDMPDGGSGLTSLEAEAVMSFYEASPLMDKMEPLIDFHDRLVDWMIKQRIKYGIWSQEEADLLRKEQPFYTPLKGFAADGDMFEVGEDNPHSEYQGPSQLGVRPKDYIKATGRASMPFDPMSNLISDAMQLTQRIARNEVGKRFLGIIRDFPDLLGNAVKVYTDSKPKIVNKGVAAPGSKKKTVGPMNMAANAKKFLVVKDGGKNFYIEFDEKTGDGQQMKRMFDNMTPKELDGALKLFTKLGGFKKQMLTRFSPVFWPINFARDVQDAVITAFSEQSRIGSPVEGKKVALRTLANLGRPSTWKAVGQYMSGRDPVSAEEVENVLLLSQMVQDGGEVGRQFVLDAETIASDIKKELSTLKAGGVKGVWGRANDKRRALVSAIDHINEFISLVPRFAAYKAAIDDGVSPDDAAKFALDSTLNLARKGEASQVVDNIWLFSNPAAQSLEKKKRIYSSKNGRKAMAGMMALGVGLHFFNMMMAGDKDDDGENDYQDMDELTKMSNLVIYTGDGPPIKLPVGFLVGFEVYLGQQLARMITNDGSGIGVLEAAANALSAFFATQIPAGERVGSITDVPKLIAPDVLFAPAVDLWLNKNAFGGQIYPEPYYEGQAVSGMARRNTGEFYKKFAQTLNRMGGGTEDIASGMDTPAEAWQYLVNQNLLVGGAALPRDVAKYFEEGAPADITKVPVAKRFVGDNREFSAQNKYYDRVKRVEVIAGQYEGENEDLAAYAESEEKYPVDSNPAVLEAFKETRKALRDLRKEKREAQREGGEGLDDTLKDIEDRQREEYVKFNQVYNDVKRGQ